MARTVITSFGRQDDTFDRYIRPRWPELELREMATTIWGYVARDVVLPQDREYLSTSWTRQYVSARGGYGAAYRVWGDGRRMSAEFDREDYFGLIGSTAEELEGEGYVVWTPIQEPGSWVSEGDSSTFLNLLDNGLRAHTSAGWGGWGGRQGPHEHDAHCFTSGSARDSLPEASGADDVAAARWFGAAQRDFAARLAWTMTERFEDANHSPVVTVEQGTELSAAAGTLVELTGSAHDPDGDAVSLRWWWYPEAGSYRGAALEIDDDGAGRVRVRVPADGEPNQTIHLILEAVDDGVPALTGYARVVLVVTED